MKRKVEDEIKFKELLKNPARLFAWVYPYFFVVILLLGIFYVKNLDKISFNTVPVSHLDSLNVVRDIPGKKGGIMPAVDLDKIKSPDQSMIDKGKELFNANCQSCHGSQGNGDGPAGAALNPKPRNFHATEGWTNGRNFPDMFKTLQEGITKNGMAAYEYIPAADRINIIFYIRTFTNFPEITENQIKDLDAAYNLSAGKVMPNQIPVKKAVALLTSEFSSDLSQKGFSGYIKSNIETKGAQLLRQFSNAPTEIEEAVFRGQIEDNFDDFLVSVSSDPEDSGYKSSIVSLNREQWGEIYSYLRGIADLNK